MIARHRTLRGEGSWDRAKRISIAEIAERYGLRLKNGSGRCPFPSHHDARASFLYSRERNHYICFGCGSRGSVIDFVAALLGIPLADAVKVILKPTAGATPIKKLTPPKVRPAEFQIDPEVYGRFLDLCPIQASGIAYLASRQITQETAVSFHIGQLSKPEQILKELQTEFGAKRLETAGLVSYRNGKNSLVFPSGFLIFPFFEGKSCTYLQARAISAGNGGQRWLGLTGVPKRLFNTRALESTDVYICEGITDVLSAYEFGLNAIGLLGATQGLPTAIAKELSSKNVYIVRDADVAGQKMAEMTSVRLLSYGIASKIQNVPYGKDLNDYLVKKRGQNGAVLQGAPAKLR